ncbi:LacI family DNA-binding transcriptional regulator [Arthrobacter sp. ATA002]|uniref:LacI family DNA-binding transcriptional regulator n=1 Tax=Arthrobacter sp. ATA002 TaxID=2991715 RepID=UPI0022A8078D|nr:LacI family DNA-binding transcriptional regulator [Arthrobacter sp. ATA002]WAP52182.1 LacI family DNA-binding transcriptional regulator [Arthrobacter sp. ATA002]
MPASTLYEVARHAGVSLATASRVLNGSSRRPGDEISERVKASAAALGYIANAQAQSLAKKNSGMLGLILHDIADPYFSTIARGVQECAQGRQKVVLLASTGGGPAGEHRAVAAFAARRADAIVLAGTRTDTAAAAGENELLLSELRRYQANGGRVAVIGQPLVGSVPGDGFRTIPVPNRELSVHLAADLARAGHRRFLILAGPEGLATSDDRLAGFQEGLRQAGCEPAEVRRTGFNRDGGYDAAAALAAELSGKPAGEARPNGSGPRGDGPAVCIFAASDVMAIGAIAGLREHSLRIPEDVAVAGFDDIETLRDFTPALTTAQLPLSGLGSEAVAQVLAEDGAAEACAAAGHVILRRSTELS